MFEGAFKEQLKRIAQKLPLAAEADREMKQFGSSSHRYTLRESLGVPQLKAWEEQYGVRFPEDYAAFLTQLGNGGAGPGYGLDGLNKKVFRASSGADRTAVSDSSENGERCVGCAVECSCRFS